MLIIISVRRSQKMTKFDVLMQDEGMRRLYADMVVNHRQTASQAKYHMYRINSDADYIPWFYQGRYHEPRRLNATERVLTSVIKNYVGARTR